MSESPDTKVLVNCWAGISRSATLALAFLMEHRDMNLKQAIKQVRMLIILEINPSLIVSGKTCPRCVSKQRLP